MTWNNTRIKPVVKNNITADTKQSVQNNSQPLDILGKFLQHKLLAKIILACHFVHWILLGLSCFTVTHKY